MYSPRPDPQDRLDEFLNSPYTFTYERGVATRAAANSRCHIKTGRVFISLGTAALDYRGCKTFRTGLFVREPSAKGLFLSLHSPNIRSCYDYEMDRSRPGSTYVCPYRYLS
jgi:hypothetical protein